MLGDWLVWLYGIDTVVCNGVLVVSLGCFSFEDIRFHMTRTDREQALKYCIVLIVCRNVSMAVSGSMKIDSSTDRKRDRNSAAHCQLQYHPDDNVEPQEQIVPVVCNIS